MPIETESASMIGSLAGKIRVHGDEGRRAFRFFVALVLLLARLVTAQGTVEYERRELKIPMRDGVMLFAVALIPKGATSPLPILLIRTPFNAARELQGSTLPESLRELGEDGYIFVVEDVRGRFGSQGTFVSLRPQRDPRDPRGVDESTDAWDTVNWLVRELQPGDRQGRAGCAGVRPEGADRGRLGGVGRGLRAGRGAVDSGTAGGATPAPMLAGLLAGSR
ncbi:MAG TPA: CocE/NonD family hydrolase [Thermoanaerobaculia bacterium]|nr:CocE/NonD family hydrolase [Thermoanaerobaculia bacterium]